MISRYKAYKRDKRNRTRKMPVLNKKPLKEFKPVEVEYKKHRSYKPNE